MHRMSSLAAVLLAALPEPEIPTGALVIEDAFTGRVHVGAPSHRFARSDDGRRHR